MVALVANNEPTALSFNQIIYSDVLLFIDKSCKYKQLSLKTCGISLQMFLQRNDRLYCIYILHGLIVLI